MVSFLILLRRWIIRVHRPTAKAKATCGNSSGRRCRSRSNCTFRPTKPGERPFWEPDICRHRHVPQNRAQEMVGPGPPGRALHREVHRPDLHDPCGAGGCQRQLVLYLAGSFSGTWCHGRLYWFRTRTYKQGLWVYTVRGYRGHEKCGRYEGS